MRKEQKSFLQTLLSIFRKLLDESAEVFRNLLKNEDINGHTAFQLAVLHNTKIVYRLLWNFFYKYFTVEEQKDLLLACGPKMDEVISNLIENHEDLTMATALMDLKNNH